ncbi:BUB3-interacting/GLEBS motif-containing protein [Thelohanellus kitauei]|uniref:BUB3-interacting/GLEBS motif-containing protein n=1 Tax=Thelohanellus kitauei TaxID=669202 RepID=A0A0C2LZT7_THEKT|nr:BUB3-interacting/GLEBS motif-containing protein [Thelohanellus kitauei]
MGRKKKKALKPWCWYCNREFDEEKVLIYHQKAKHFKCHICGKKLYTGPGLSIHCSQVHQRSVTAIANALPHRSDPDVEIYGTEGIPFLDVMARARQKKVDIVMELPKPESACYRSGMTAIVKRSTAKTPQFLYGLSLLLVNSVGLRRVIAL